MGCVESLIPDCLAQGVARSEGAGARDRGEVPEGRRRPRRPGTDKPGDVSDITVDIREPDPKEEEVLRVEGVDLKVQENARSHHTDEYDVTEGPNPKLVVRRGQEFNVTITFSRQYAKDRDDLRLVFQIGDNPKPTKGTHVEFVLSDKEEAGEWGAKIAQQSGNSLTITVFTPPECIVGRWVFKVDVVKRKDEATAVFRYTHKDLIYVLFNPWCPKDPVFLDNARERDAYLMNDRGRIYAGSHKSISAKPWVFGQFTDPVLDCSMYLLEMSRLNMAVRGNPIPIVRKLSALVNSSDEGGVLTGNWSGDYAGGKSPLSWTGSVAILEQYYKQKYPVRFGQCWVFSGVLTTVCRALGIPARSVTNFSSAHDVDASITIDIHYNEEGPIEHMNEDSIWNFHVWNEVWMTRPDLPTGFGGWQAIDATPQEASDGIYCCGPCPVRAVKEGEVNMPYDGPFIFAEVNADRVYWMIHADGKHENLYVEKNTVGKFISTMSLNGDREDVTKCYKYPEDSAEERVAVRRANQMGSARRDVYQEGPKDVDFELYFDSDNSFVGQDFELVLICTNKSKEARTICGRVSASTMFYTGIVANPVGNLKIEYLELGPGESKKQSLKVTPDDYAEKLKDGCMLSVSALAKVVETKQIFTKKDDTRLRKPHLSIKAPTSVQAGQQFEVQVSFTNPMAKKLTECFLEVDGPGLTKAKTYPQNDVEGKDTFLTTLKLQGIKKGSRQIVAIFRSKQLEDINGTHDIEVKA